MNERLGHSTPAFTLQQYAHVIPGMQAEAANAIADLIRPKTREHDNASSEASDE
jgi:hypothetical protein